MGPGIFWGLYTCARRRREGRFTDCFFLILAIEFEGEGVRTKSGTFGELRLVGRLLTRRRDSNPQPSRATRVLSPD